MRLLENSGQEGHVEGVCGACSGGREEGGDMLGYVGDGKRLCPTVSARGTLRICRGNCLHDSVAAFEELLKCNELREFELPVRLCAVYCWAWVILLHASEVYVHQLRGKPTHLCRYSSLKSSLLFLT